MCAQAFWAENSHFECSWQTQLRSQLCSVLSDFGGGGGRVSCRLAASTNQAVRDVQKGEKTEAPGIQFQFWVADDDSTSIFSHLKISRNDVSRKSSLEVHRDCQWLAGPSTWTLATTKAFRTGIRILP